MSSVISPELGYAIGTRVRILGRRQVILASSTSKSPTTRLHYSLPLNTGLAFVMLFTLDVMEALDIGRQCRHLQ